MGLCCCKIKDDDAPPVRQRQSTANLLPPLNTNGYPRNFGTIQPVRHNAQPVRPKTLKPTVSTARLAPRNDRIATNISYPKVLPREETIKRLIEAQRHKRISYKRKVTLNVEMLQELFTALDIDVTTLPIPTRHNTYVTNRLQPGSNHYTFARNRLNNQRFLEKYRITEILHIWNPYTLAQFKLRKFAMENMYDERVTERMLFHGSKVGHLRNILTNNFDWRKVKNGLCGWGISFANNPYYASHYSIKDCNSGGQYLMILAKVLIGRESYGNSSTKVPPEGDTTTRLKDRQVYVKYDDCSFYPEFVVYFTNKY